MFSSNSALRVPTGYMGEQELGAATVVARQSGAMLTAGSTSNEELRTLFITGFPVSVQERELQNLVFALPGCQASQMNTRPAAGGPPQGFVLFSSAAAAHAALRVLHDLEFDTGCHLRCELAHKNMYMKDDASTKRTDGRAAAILAPAAIGGGGPAASHPSALAANGQQYGAAAGGGLAGSAFGGPLLASSLAALRPGAGVGGGGTLLPPPGAAGAMAAQHAGLMGAAPVAGFGPVTNRFDNPPCNTLFIGNLGDGVDEKELVALFSCQPGYKQLKLLRQARNVSCFVEFSDTPSATAVHTTLQGALLPSSSRGPIRIQYSRNPYGRRAFPASGMGIMTVPMMTAGLYAPLGAAGGAVAPAAAYFDAAAAAGGSAAGGGSTVIPGSMASVIMAASAGGEYGAWPQQFGM